MKLRTAADVGTAIRTRRRALGWDQAELAKRVGVGRVWVVAMEKGKPRAALRLVLRALDVLGITPTVPIPGSAEPSKGEIPGEALDLSAILRRHRRQGPAR